MYTQVVHESSFPPTLDCDVFLGVEEENKFQKPISKYRNPFSYAYLLGHRQGQKGLEKYKNKIQQDPELKGGNLEKLAGKKLGCTCTNRKFCYGEILKKLIHEWLEIKNGIVVCDDFILYNEKSDLFVPSKQSIIQMFDKCKNTFEEQETVVPHFYCSAVDNYHGIGFDIESAYEMYKEEIPTCVLGQNISGWVITASKCQNLDTFYDTEKILLGIEKAFGIVKNNAEGMMPLLWKSYKENKYHHNTTHFTQKLTQVYAPLFYGYETVLNILQEKNG